MYVLGFEHLKGFNLIFWSFEKWCSPYGLFAGGGGDTTVFPNQSSADRGGSNPNTTTSKGLMHSNDHLKDPRATIEGGGVPLYPPLGESLRTRSL